MPDMRGHGDQWSLLVPVKRLDIAKSRLDLAVPARSALALAMAMDTVRAALGASFVAEVLVITSDDLARSALSAIGARVVDDEPDTGLNPALRHGVGLAGEPKVAALSSDLPSLRSHDLDQVLRVAGTHRKAVVADREGTGTTLLAADAEDFDPRFGVGSFATHVAAGSADLTAWAAPSLRHDVDTVSALRAAVSEGVGPETARALTGIDLTDGHRPR